MFGVNCIFQKLIITLLVMTAFILTLANCFTCETPDDWLTGDPDIQRRLSVRVHHFIVLRDVKRRGQKWPNGIVKYKFNQTLTLEDMSEVHKAFDEYHTKTCIKFEPWQSGDADFISIEADDNICGFANVCKLGGYQFVRFGGNCKTMATMVHELAHALCFSHEHQRMDRDMHLRFPNCRGVSRKVTSAVVTRGLYDYSSQTHYECNWCRGGWPIPENVTGCGQEITQGLSVLDVDAVNSNYGCQGCRRHRWVPVNSLSHEDRSNMFTFGIESKNGPIYACRARVRWEIAPGVYDYFKKTCKVSSGWKVYDIKDQVEVLTIPGGLKKDCSVYKLEDNDKAAFGNIIQAGTSFRRDNAWTMHLAYGAITKDDGNLIDYSAGKVWVKDGGPLGDYSAEIPQGVKSYKLTKFKVLTCKVDTACLLEQYLDDRKVLMKNAIND